MLRDNRHPVVRVILLTAVLLFVYFVVAIPFKVMSVIPGFTDIRPVGLLQPVYGIFFGVPGCIAFAVGNLIGDIVSDSLRWSSIAGFAANFTGPFLYYLLLCRLAKEPYSLKTGKGILKQTAVTAASAIAQTVMITPVVKLVYPEVSGMTFALSVLLNDSVFPLMLGIPLIILMQEELGFRPQESRIKPKG